MNKKQNKQPPVLVAIGFISFLVLYTLNGCTIFPNGSTLVKAKSGEPQPQYEIGLTYEVGNKVVKDDKIAREWYKKSAKSGYPQAQNKLGVFYREGLGGEQSNTKSRQWFELASSQGSPVAQYNLGLLYKEGLSTPRNNIKARELFQKAARKGLPEAQYELGLMYKLGLGVTKNTTTALSFFYLSQANGSTKGNVGVEITEVDLTTSQISKAQEIATNFHLRYLSGRSPNVVKPPPVKKNTKN